MTERKQKCGSHKRLDIGRLVIAIIVIVSIAAPIVGSIFLLSIDRYHDCYQQFFVKYFLEYGNYYDGATWFTVTATLIGGIISAVPGLMCGVLALVQTRRLNKLEAKYHRPRLELENAQFCCAEVDRFSQDDKTQWKGLESQQRNGILEAKKQPFAWWLQLTVNLSLSNEIGVQHIEIESVKISFPNADPQEECELYLKELSNSTIRSFRRTIKDSHPGYTLSYCLNPFRFKPLDAKDYFDNCIHDFASYSESHDPKFSQMDLTVTMNLKHEYIDQETNKCLLRITFDKSANDKTLVGEASTAQTSCINPNIKITQSANGYVTYEV